MTCPKTFTVTSVSNSKKAEDTARSLARAFRCPEPCCYKVKSISKPVTSPIKLPPMPPNARLYWPPTAIKATIEIKCVGVDDKSDCCKFLKDFSHAAYLRHLEVGTVASGRLNNLIVGFSFGTFGDGCTAWLDWMWEWFWKSEWTKTIKVKGMTTKRKLLLFRHQVMVATCPDGTLVVLDPMNDSTRRNPVWGFEAWQKEYGKLYPFR